MTFGFRLVGNSGYYQVDENNPNLVFRGKFTLTTNNNKVATLTITGDTPIPVIRSPGGWTGMYRTDRNGSQFTYYFITYAPNFTFDVYLFDRINAGESPANWGLNVYGPDGRLNFSSNRRLLPVYGMVGQVVGSTSDSSVGANLPYGTWGAVPSEPLYRGAPNTGGGGARQYASAVRTEPTTISAFPASFPTGVIVPTSGGRPYSDVFFVVFDLSGLG